MDKKSEYIEKFISKCEAGTTLISEYKNAQTKITLQCNSGHTRTTTSNTIISKGGGVYCKECKGKSSGGKKLDSYVDTEFKAQGLIKLEEYKGALTPLLARNIVCGHEYTVVPSNISRGRLPTCGICQPTRRNFTAEDFAQEILKLGLIPVIPYTGMKTNILVKNTKCEHIYEINPGHLVYDNIGVACKECKNSTRNRFFSKLLENKLELLSEYATTQVPVTIKNLGCGHEYAVIPNNLVCADTGVTCKVCEPTIQVSKAEVSIVEFIKSFYTGWIEVSDRNILHGQELDIVLPDLGIAIEYNGMYWHSEQRRGIDYHLDKTKQVENFGYRLIHIYETEWLRSPEIVKSRLRSIIGHLVKIYARKTTTRKIEYPAKFLDANHIQGSGSITKYNYGLFEKDELVAVMTFSVPRFNKDHDYELVRYCSLLNTTIVGGASKLLAAFRKDMPGKTIVSYSDKRWSTGDLYKAIGFKYSHTSVPNYRYYKYKYSLSRYQCQKHLLEARFPEFYNLELSETEIMSLAGYSKVFDCGNDVWTLK